MKRKLIIHVGMGKTGSSSIQKSLFQSRSLLLDNGVYYLGLMLENYPLTSEYSWHLAAGWRHLTTLSLDDRTKQLAAAFNEINKNLPTSIHTLVWSNESLFVQPGEFKILMQFLNEYFETCIVGYIRRPDAWILSAYLQWGIKHKSYKGGLKNFNRWVDDKRYVASPMMREWSELAFQSGFHNFDAIDNVCEHFITTYLPIMSDSIKSIRANESPSPVALSLFALYNSSFSREVLPDELEPLLKNSKVWDKNAQPRAVNVNSLLPSEEAIAKFVATHSDEIDNINQIFSESGESMFHIDSIKYKDYSVNQVEILRSLLRMITYLNDELISVKKETGNLQLKFADELNVLRNEVDALKKKQ